MATPKNAAQILARALDGNATLDSPDVEGTMPIEIVLQARGKARRFAAYWAGAGRTHEVREALASVPSPWPRNAVLVARDFSADSLDLLRARDGNWADESGRARILGDDILVIREMRSPGTRASNRTWSRSAIDIAEAILARDWPRGIGTGDLAEATGWSPAQVTEVLQGFDESGWTEKRGPQRGPGAGRNLVDLPGLLDSWSDVVSTSEPERRFAHGVPQETLELLHGTLSESLDQRVRWALTGWAASELLAPALTSSPPTIQIYVSEEDFFGPLTDAIAESGLQEVEEGGIVEFRAANSGVLSLSVPKQDLLVASPPRVYADLIALGGRGEDAARHLREQVIEPTHRPFVAGVEAEDLEEWEWDCERRLEALLSESGEESPYALGGWSVSYELEGSARSFALRDFRDVLLNAVGSETGWPTWFFPGEESRPRIAENMIECRIIPNVFSDPSHRDYWRADPTGRMFLKRGFEEDGGMEGLAPSTTLDLSLPVWRIGECLLHAQRLATEFDASGIRFRAKWTGLRGRKLQAVASRERLMTEEWSSAQDEVVSVVEIRARNLLETLPHVVRALVEPLYTVFDFFVPPESLYREELGRMTNTNPNTWT